MFVTEKHDADGNFEKIKSRLVAMGNEQDREAIMTETSSPTVASTAVYNIAAMAAVERGHVITLDVTGAFLNAYVPEGVKIRVRLGRIDAELLCQMKPEYRKFLTPGGELIVELERALYGCIQSARLWFDEF